MYCDAHGSCRTWRDAKGFLSRVSLKEALHFGWLHDCFAVCHFSWGWCSLARICTISGFYRDCPCMYGLSTDQKSLA